MNIENKKILVIHPFDDSTDFLIPIYKDLDCTVIRDNYNNINNEIIEHDIIIMLGHGTPVGLLLPDKEYTYFGYVISAEHAKLLSTKECVFIWCNADHYVKQHNLSGIYTGMIISEYIEAQICYVSYISGDVEYSNDLFSKAMKSAIISDNPVAVATSIYNGNSQIIKYNRKKIYYK